MEVKKIVVEFDLFLFRFFKLNKYFILFGYIVYSILGVLFL